MPGVGFAGLNDSFGQNRRSLSNEACLTSLGDQALRVHEDGRLG